MDFGAPDRSPPPLRAGLARRRPPEPLCVRRPGRRGMEGGGGAAAPAGRTAEEGWMAAGRKPVRVFDKYQNY